MLAVATLWRREVIRFVRQRSRLVGALAQPLVFWLLLGGGLSPSFRPPGAPVGATQGFHAIMNLLLIPIWLLSGAFFPPAGVPAPLAWLMRLDPLTYGLAALRACLDPAAMGLPPFVFSLGVAMVFGAGACAAAVATARRAAVAA